jgi:branched-chain amino acid transport system permease protein
VGSYRTVLGLVALAAALLAPLAVGQFWMTLITQIYIYGLLALSVDLLLGHAGLYSLCHASFFAVAAYTTAILQARHGVPTLLAAPAGILAGTLLAILYGASVRTRGVYFILITIALGYIIWGAVYRWASFTGGDNGITNVPPPSIGSVTVASQTAYYYFALAVVLLCALGYRILIRSPFRGQQSRQGLRWLARGRRRHATRRAGRAARPDRTQWCRQDHAVPLRDRDFIGIVRPGAVVRP